MNHTSPMRRIEALGSVMHRFRYKRRVNSHQTVEQTLFYVCASDKLLYKILGAIGFNIIKRLGNIRVVDFCADNGTSLKTLLSRPIFGNFKGHLLLQVQIVCKIDFLHASFTCKRLDRVA